MTADTIAAIATPPGRGAVAIVRVSGPGTEAVARRVFRGGRLRPRRAVFGTVRAPDGATIDRGLAIFFAGPRSYTGEDVLELHVHGSVAVARETLLATLAAGARLATPGEFTRRAFVYGKIDLCEAEAVAELIESERRGAARAAAARLAGGLAGEVERLRRELREILERLAAALDFPDEVDPPAPEELEAAIARIDADLATLAASWEHGRLVREGLAVAVVGPPNAGKSSLVNALLGTERVLVSDVPGTTRDTVEESLALGNGAFARLIDTAGLRAATDPVEAAGIARSDAALAHATVALVVLDGSRPLDAEARRVLERTRGRARLVYFNKRDLGAAGYEERGADERDALAGTVHDAADVTAVRRGLAALAESEPPDAARPTLGTARQADAVLAARRALAQAVATLTAGDPIDLAATDLASADAALGALTGRDASEALLDAIFARFCIGK
jgi:tRNA modification GTPase